MTKLLINICIVYTTILKITLRIYFCIDISTKAKMGKKIDCQKTN